MNHFTTNEWSLKTQEGGDGVWIFLPLGSTGQLTLSLLPTHIIGTSVETYYWKCWNLLFSKWWSLTYAHSEIIWRVRILF